MISRGYRKEIRKRWKSLPSAVRKSLRSIWRQELSVTAPSGDLSPRGSFFPCFFGSALHVQGVEELLDGLERYTQTPQYGEEFGAKVYKIARDDQGNRLTYLKITGGTLRVKEVLPDVEEKVNQIRIYSGAKY